VGIKRQLLFGALAEIVSSTRKVFKLNIFFLRKYTATELIIHLSPDCVRFFGKDVLEIPELKSNLIIGNLY